MEALQEKSLVEKLCKTPFEEIFGEKQLKMLRFSICETIFMVVLKNYIDSLPMTVEEDRYSWIVDEYEVSIR